MVVVFSCDPAAGTTLWAGHHAAATGRSIAGGSVETHLATKTRGIGHIWRTKRVNCAMQHIFFFISLQNISVVFVYPADLDCTIHKNLIRAR